jgi:hypothetical protein
VLGAIVQRKVGKISEAKGHGQPNDEGAHGEGEEDEKESVVVARSGVAIFHVYIIAPPPENARIFPKKLIVLSAWYTRT